MSDEKIPVFLTKYVFTKGIVEVDAKLCSDKMISYRAPWSAYTDYAHGVDWHMTREDAVAHAEQKRVKKLAALRKQITKIEKLSFS